MTNDVTQDSTAATQKACSYRWKIEQLHREGKQVTGLESCECRKARIQRNHIACALLVWVRRTELAVETGQSINSNMACWMTTSFSNSSTLRSK